MTADRHSLPIGALPRMMTLDQAAEYCGISAQSFRGVCPVIPKDMGLRALRWDRVDLDRWLDGLPVRGKAQGDEEPKPVGLKESAIANVRRRAAANAA